MRSRSLTFVCIILFSLFAYNLLGAVSAYQRLEFLRALPLTLPPTYFLMRDAFWAAVFLILSLSLWNWRGWARWASVAAVALYVAHGWAERLIWAQAEYVSVTRGWVLCVDLALLAVVAWVLLRPKTAQAFKLQGSDV